MSDSLSPSERTLKLVGRGGDSSAPVTVVPETETEAEQLALFDLPPIRKGSGRGRSAVDRAHAAAARRRKAAARRAKRGPVMKAALDPERPTWRS